MRAVAQEGGRAQATIASPGAHSSRCARSIHSSIYQVWGAERPPPPPCRVWVHPEALAGKSTQQKLADCRTSLAANNARALLVTTL